MIKYMMVELLVFFGITIGLGLTMGYAIGKVLKGKNDEN